VGSGVGAPRGEGQLRGGVERAAIDVMTYCFGSIREGDSRGRCGRGDWRGWHLRTCALQDACEFQRGPQTTVVFIPPRRRRCGRCGGGGVLTAAAVVVVVVVSPLKSGGRGADRVGMWHAGGERAPRPAA